MVEDVYEGTGAGEKRDLAIGVAQGDDAGEESESKSHGDDAHVLHGREGEQLLEIDLREREEDSAQRTDDTERQDRPSANRVVGNNRAGRREEAVESVEAERNHRTRHDGRGRCRCGGMGFGKPDVEGREAYLEAEADDGAEERD